MKRGEGGGRGYGGELYRRENGKAEGNLNEETRDNAWAKRPEQNGTSFGGGEEAPDGVVERDKGDGIEGRRGRGRMAENNRGIKLETATEKGRGRKEV